MKIREYISRRVGWMIPGLRKAMPVLAVIIVLELILAPILPRVLPRSWYLKSYLQREALREVGEFLDGRLCIEPDNLLGWRNRAACCCGKIENDKFGARSSRYIPGPTPFSGRSTKVILLGDSLIHGWNRVTNQETISHFLNNHNMEAVNFGCVSYGLDQVSLLMERTAARFKPDVVVIGLESGGEEIVGCHFQPFIYRSEICVPFLKPRYVLANGKLELKVPDFRKLLKGLPYNKEFFDFLEKNDPYYKNFVQYQQIASTPLLGLFHEMKQKTETSLRRVAGWPEANTCDLESEDFKLLEALVMHTVRLAHQNDIQLIYLLFPGKEYLKDNDGSNYDRLKAFFRDHGVMYVDVLQNIKKQGYPYNTFIKNFHYTPQGNRIIAQSLALTIEKEEQARTGHNRGLSGDKSYSSRIY